MTSLALEIDGLYCAACVGRAERVVKKLPQVVEAEVNLARQTLALQLQGPAELQGVADVLSRAGYGLRSQITRLEVEGMTCASCVARVERSLTAHPLVRSASVNLADHSVTIDHWAGPEVLAEVQALLARAGYGATLPSTEGPDRQALEEQAMKHRFLWALILTLPVFLLEMGGHMVPAFHHWLHGAIGMTTSWAIQAVFSTLVLFGPGRLFLRRGLPNLWRAAPDMNSLVALGGLAAWAYSMVALLLPDLLPAEALAVYFEAAAVIVTLVLLGRWLEARARGRTGQAIRRLVDLQPLVAHVEGPQGFEDRPLARVQLGDILQILPGERLPADGVVVAGRGFVDESMLTGEPVPVEKGIGDQVTGGTVNGTSALRVQVSRTGADSRLSQILRLVSQAQAGKLPIQAMVDRVTAVFVPVVMAIAALAVVVWLMLGAPLSDALVAGVSVLIVACPCAMGLATPTSILVGTGRAAELGILFRKGEALQRLAGLKVVAFDKTGTLTQGRPEVVQFLGDPDQLLQLAAGLEAQSEHPLAHAVLRGAEARGLSVPDAQGVRAVIGQGLVGEVAGRRVALGNPVLMAAEGADISGLAAADAWAAQGSTLMYVAQEGRALGVIAVSDPVKPSSRAAVADLHQAGLSVMMVSGDSPLTAQAVGQGLGMTQVHAGLSPEGKVEVLESRGPLAFVGDGLNDAPALAAADVGIAMGQGTDVAIEAADVILTTSDPRAVGVAHRLSQAVMGNIRQNLFWAFGYNAALIPVAAGVLKPAFGITLSPMLAAGAMALSSVFVLGNALRLRGFGVKS